MKKATDREVREAYAATGSIWKAGEALGMCGQSVHERLVKMGVDRSRRHFTEREAEELRALYETGFESGDGQLKALAKKLGRTVPFLSRKARTMGLTDPNRFANETLRRSIGTTKAEWIERNGHPRGMLGKDHTAETKRRLSTTSKEMWDRMSDDEKAKRVFDMAKARIQIHGVPRRPHTSWKQGWREVGGQRAYFRSRWEANYARYLEFLREQDQITSWEHEPETFWFEGIKRGAVSYLPDFRVTYPDGSVEYHEVKGWMDKRSKTKLRRMKKYHPEVKMVVIAKRAYKEIERKIGAALEGWE